ncbi:MAG TPA: RNA methyltransferase [Chitinivibrionales bacterium]|nr:RNA methyltransferase [Chitinivibrionales bacterium]
MNPSSPENVVYGIHPVGELLSTGIRRIDRLYFDKDGKSAALFELVKLARKERLAYQMVPAQKLGQLCGSDKHQGTVALCSAKEFMEPDALLEMLSVKTTPPLLFIPASVEDPRNLGALIRTCVAFGVDAMLLERKNTAPIGPTVAKAAAGMLEHLPLVKPKNLEGLVATLAAKGYAVVGAAAGSSEKPQDIDLTGPSIIITGGENRGIPPYLAKQCARTAAIPIAAAASSLNVSAAAAVLLYECARQRDFAFVKNTPT